MARKPSPCGSGIGGWLSSWLKYAAPKCEEVGSEEGGAGAESRNADGGSLSWTTSPTMGLLEAGKMRSQSGRYSGLNGDGR